MIAAYRRTHSPSLKVTLITVHYKLVFFLLLWLTDDGICCAERHTSILLHWNGTDCAVENEGSHVIGEFVDGRGVQFWNCRREGNCHMAKR